jgi:hypothetical protein
MPGVENGSNIEKETARTGVVSEPMGMGKTE